MRNSNKAIIIKASIYHGKNKTIFVRDARNFSFNPARQSEVVLYINVHATLIKADLLMTKKYVSIIHESTHVAVVGKTNEAEN